MTMSYVYFWLPASQLPTSPQIKQSHAKDCNCIFPSHTNYYPAGWWWLCIFRKHISDQQCWSCTSEVSVATVMTNVFQTNGIIAPRKLAKIVRITLSEVDKYLHKPVKNIKDPLKWWAAHCHVYHNLSDMTLDYLIIPSNYLTYLNVDFITNHILHSYIHCSQLCLLARVSTPSIHLEPALSFFPVWISLSQLFGGPIILSSSKIFWWLFGKILRGSGNHQMLSLLNTYYVLYLVGTFDITRLWEHGM